MRFDAIKITPAGNTAWVRVENFGGSTFYLVHNIRLKGRGAGVWIARDAGDNVYTASSEGIIRLHKRDKFGNFLWEVSFTTDSLFNYETPTRVHADSQGNVVVVGFRYTTSIENGNRANALIVLKYTALPFKRILCTK